MNKKSFETLPHNTSSFSCNFQLDSLRFWSTFPKFQNVWSTFANNGLLEGKIKCFYNLVFIFINPKLLAENK